ncbi:hypothetical protein HOY82DRAFT_606324 [Tuber indicum]|nr:hypothetical protein HOY82DRAFT_606324 [Tuber indicum]
MFAVQGLRAAARRVQKKRFGELMGYTYVNPGGSSILKEIQALRTQGEQTAKELGRMADWALTMQPLQSTAIEIRLRFFANYQKLGGARLGDGAKAIRMGNEAAHEGNILTDIIMIRDGHLVDKSVFYELYGIAFDASQPYTKCKGIVEIINKRASMRANPHRFSKPWNVKLQRDFQDILGYFDKAGAQNWEQLEQGTPGSIPERQAWLRITQAARRRGAAGC